MTEPTASSGSSSAFSSASRPTAGPASPTTPVQNRPPAKRKKHWGRRIFGTLILLAIIGFSLWAWITVSLAYASGQKTGYITKLTRQGWLCKTWEGELSVTPLPGTALQPQTFPFTVRSDSIGLALQQLVGQRVVLTYDQHRGVPTSCFGETEDYISGVRATP